MNSSFYPKLALTNIKKNRKSYIPYMFTCVLTVMMYYVMHALAKEEGINKIVGSATLRIMLTMAMGIVAIFAVIFLFYTNSFLMKQRKKEIGLYNVLGMGKRHIAKMMVWESIYTMLVSLVIGILCGILFAKLALLILLKLVSYSVPLTFPVSVPAIIGCLILFGIIFVITLVFNLFQIRLSNPIELLHGGNKGEKEPKTKWILTIFGFVTIGIGYYIAQTTESPLAAVSLFFGAVILVILGTYALFVAGSVTLLKALKKNKKFYYKTAHFTSVAGMIYRMKQNAVGLANICILSTIVLVMISTSVSLRIGLDDALESRYPHQVHIGLNVSNQGDEDGIAQVVEEVTKKNHVKVKNHLAYKEMGLVAGGSKDKLVFSERLSSLDASEITQMAAVSFLTEESYNDIYDDNISLQPDEAIVLDTNKGAYGYPTITIGSRTFKVAKDLKESKLDNKDYMLTRTLYVFVADESVMGEIAAESNQIEQEMAKNGQEIIENEISYTNDFDLSGSDSDVQATYEELKQRIGNDVPNAYMEVREDNRQEFLGMYGGLLFIGIFVGILFLMATVLIIYYKQISEGMDDQKRFAILQKVGMSQKEVKRTIKSQVVTVFFLPLAAAVIHIAVAFKVITLLLKALNLSNVSLFLNCTIGTVVVFAIFYAIVYGLTAREYYKIVK